MILNNHNHNIKLI